MTRDALDPKGLIREAYRIEGIGAEECRAIFFDWAMGLDAALDPVEAARRLHDDLAADRPDHPMSGLLAQAAQGTMSARRRRRGRRQ